MAALAVPLPRLELLTRDIITAAAEVHRCLGPGHLEQVYRECMCHELRMRNVVFDRDVPFPVRYKGLPLAQGYRIDLLVGACVAVELKAAAKLPAVHQTQLLACLRLKRLPLGLLINFNEGNLRAGIIRVAA
jgi:GxxExxY protein